MTHQLERRRRQIRAKGRNMTLQRLVKASSTVERSVPLLGVATGYAPEQLSGGVQQGDLRVETLNDELAAAGWPHGEPPRRGDKLLIDTPFTLQGAWPVHAGGFLIGWRLWVRGGA